MNSGLPLAPPIPCSDVFLSPQKETYRLTHKYLCIELGQYRIKAHCNYDPASSGTTDYSVFQVEILDEKLRHFYKGHFLLEVWSKQGERIFQKVLQEEIPESQWELHNNVLVFKASSEAQHIYVMFLAERKMASVNHPYEDHQEVDLQYFDSYLIVAQAHSLRFLQITAADVTTHIDQFQLDKNGAGMPVLPYALNREFSGILPSGRIVGCVHNPVKNELIYASCNEQFQLSFYKLNINSSKAGERR